jgi:hypothetical protein
VTEGVGFLEEVQRSLDLAAELDIERDDAEGRVWSLDDLARFRGSVGLVVPWAFRIEEVGGGARRTSQRKCRPDGRRRS